MKIIGKICPKHKEDSGLRYANGQCCKCQNAATRAYYQKNKEKHAKIVADYYVKITKQKQKENPEHFRLICKKFRERHPEKQKIWGDQWRKNNRDRWLENSRQSWIRRYALIGDQQLAKKFSSEIKKIYRECPVGHEVDHIIPLRGQGVIGLHVPWNLQYLPAIENRRKANKVSA